MDRLEIRKEIDTLDDQLTGLFVRRMELCGQMADYKIANNLPLLDRGRERDIGCLCYGHTHEPVAQLQSDGRWLINPGTAGGIGNRATYAVVQVED